ncbi:hypothetical protein DERF_005498 [Dermatophagoides farinae]|uniref:Uncharacterized protein n=1 Tax=Dermatophagoides farinae TaxID=6954 RepID=A0A922L686_DERFA|nr:hypothetical protein DERF_005498 [Dermatophagoides farinae]
MFDISDTCFTTTFYTNADFFGNSIIGFDLTRTIGLDLGGIFDWTISSFGDIDIGVTNDDVSDLVFVPVDVDMVIVVRLVSCDRFCCR